MYSLNEALESLKLDMSRENYLILSQNVEQDFKQKTDAVFNALTRKQYLEAWHGVKNYSNIFANTYKASNSKKVHKLVFEAQEALRIKLQFYSMYKPETGIK